MGNGREEKGIIIRAKEWNKVELLLARASMVVWTGWCDVYRCDGF